MACDAVQFSRLILIFRMNLVHRLPIILKKEAAEICETLAPIRKTARNHILEDHSLHSLLKFYS
jgi:hypothetical protein